MPKEDIDIDIDIDADVDTDVDVDIEIDLQKTPTSWNMHVGWFLLVFLLSFLWGWRTVMFQLSGFYCRLLSAVFVGVRI